MRNVVFTLFQGKRSRQGQELSQSWEAWCSAFSTHQQRGSEADTNDIAALNDAKDGAAIMLGQLKPGTTRSNKNVDTIHALSLDIEGVPNETVTDALDSLSAFEYVVWTTHKHGSEVAKGMPRLRVLLPLDKPITPEQARRAWYALDTLVGGINDKSTKDPARLNFLPSTFDAAKSGAFTYRNPNPDKRWLDAATDLPEPTLAIDYGTDEPATEVRVAKLRKMLSKVPKMDKLRTVATRLAGGSILATPGERHTAIRDITMWLAIRDPLLPGAVVLALFAGSIEAMANDTPDDYPDEGEVLAAYNSAAEKVRQGDEEFNAERRRRIQLEQAGEATAYDESDLRRIARANGWSPEELGDRWIIQREGAYWFLNAEGRYMGPFVKDDAAIAVRHTLGRAPVNLITVTQSSFRHRPLPDIVTESGQVATKILSDMTIDRTRYDPTTGALHEAVSPLRDIAPCFDDQLDQWLKLLGGPVYGKLLDWMSCATDLNKLLCAIYFAGHPGTGKTLFGHGMAKLWTQGPPADIEHVLSSFNDDIVRCPLVLGDEEMPQRFGKATVTTALRSILSTTHRTLNRKYKPPTELRGAVRLVLTANNQFLLDSKDVASQQDLTAIAQRFLYVETRKAAADYLESIPRETKIRWGEEGIAAHALWLAQNHELVKPGKRFWVEGTVSAMHRLLITGSRWNSLVCEWLARYLMNPQPFQQKASAHLILRREGKLFVNVQAIIDGWGLYIQETHVDPDTKKIAAALRAISVGPSQPMRPGQGRPAVRYRHIDADHVYAWSRENGIGDEETMGTTLAQPEDTPNNIRSIK